MFPAYLRFELDSNTSDGCFLTVSYKFDYFFKIILREKWLQKNGYKRTFIKRQTSGTSSDNGLQRMVKRMTTKANEWQRVINQVTKNDNKDNE